MQGDQSPHCQLNFLDSPLRDIDFTYLHERQRRQENILEDNAQEIALYFSGSNSDGNNSQEIVHFDSSSIQAGEDPILNEVNLTKRVNNTIFKTSLSQYRKSIIDIIKSDSSLQWLRRQIKMIYRAKNQSNFLKFNIIVRELGLEQNINKRWIIRIKKLKQKKQELLQKGKYCQNRYQKLLQSIEIITSCIGCKNIGETFDRYWGNYRQQQKYQCCKRQVDRFHKQFLERLRQRSESSGNQKRPPKKGKPSVKTLPNHRDLAQDK